MAIVGEAHIIVRAITTSVEKDIRKGFSGISGAGSEAGNNLGRSFRKALDSQMNESGPGKLANALRGLVPEAEQAYQGFRRLVRIGYPLQSGLGAIGGSIGAVAGGLGALIGVAGGAAAALVAVASAGVGIGTGFGLAKFALGGVGEALREASAAGAGGGGRDNTADIEAAQRKLAEVVAKNSDRLVDANNEVTLAQERLNRALREGREELQQISFSAEQAALDEKEAAIELEKARETLQGVQDLPPNSRARREALLAYEQAELNLRLAQDAASDLAAEEQRLSRLGVEGTEDVIDARRELAEAEEDRIRVIRDNAFDLADAEADLEEALRKTTAALGASTRAYDKLTASQKDFVGFLKQIKPLFAGLREDVASGFLPVLQTQIQRFIDAGLVEVLSKGLTEVGIALGEASETFSGAFLDNRGLENLSRFFSSTSTLLPSFGRTLGLSFGNFLKIIEAAEPITRKFVEFIEKKAQSFSDFLDVKDASGELEAFFNRAGELGARFGDVFGNIFGFLGDLIMANFGPGSGGDLLLTWLQTVTQGFNDIDATFLERYSEGAAKNAIALLDSFGAFFEMLIRAGSDPAIQAFYNNLDLGASSLNTIIKESVQGAPALGRFLSLAVRIIEVFTDSESINAFFGVLNTVLGSVLRILESIPEEILDVIGVIFATITAITLIGSTIGTTGKIFSGFFISGLSGFAKLFGASNLLSGALVGQAGISSATARAALTANSLVAAAKLREGVAVDVVTGKLVTQGIVTRATAQAVITANAAVAASQGAVGLAVDKTSGSLVVAGATGVAAGNATAAAGVRAQLGWGPIGLILLAITAAFAGLMYISGQTQKKIDDASQQATNSMKAGADATTVWNSALGAVGDTATREVLAGTKNLAGEIEGLSAKQVAGSQVMSRYGTVTLAQNKISDGYKNTLTAVGNSLGNLATTNLPAAQRSFNGLVAAQKISKTTAMEMLTTNDGLRTSFIDQAAQMGINIYTTDGLIDEQLLYNFAVGEGEIAQRNATAAAAEAAQQTRDLITAQNDAVMAASGFKDALTDAISEVNGKSQFSMEQALENFRNSMDSAAKLNTNLAILASKGVSEAGIQAIRDAGPNAGIIAQGIVDGTSAEFAEFKEVFDKVAVQSTDAFKDTQALIQKRMELGLLGEEEGAALIEALFNASSGDEVQAVGRQVRASIVQGLRTGGAISLPFSLKSTGPTMGSIIFGSTGGFVEEGAIKAAMGGLIRGVGTSTSDSIPAFLSNGEYVINARSTARYKPLLDAINSGVAGSSATPSPTSVTGGNTYAPEINITVNPSAGMDERELAKLVSKEIAYSMRKGAMS
jgi:hypothetical protein